MDQDSLPVNFNLDTALLQNGKVRVKPEGEGYRLTLADIETLSGVAGVAAGSRDVRQSSPPIPGAWPESNNEIPLEELDQTQEREVRQALIAFVLGHAEEVESYRRIIERRYFPFAIFAQAEENLWIQAGQTVHIGDPARLSRLHYQTITLEEGGLLQVDGSVIVSVNTFVKQTA